MIRAARVRFDASTIGTPDLNIATQGSGIVKFAGESVRAIGQTTTDEIEVGDEVRPVYVEQLRDPEAGIRYPDSQSWDGFRFEPTQ